MLKHHLAIIVACLVVASAARLPAQQGDRGTDAAKADIDPAIARITPPAPFRTVEEEMRTFKVAPGFRVEVVAVEPLVQEPVAMQFAPDGKLWVVEMRAYMMDVDGTGENDLIGDIVVLEDTNKDGRYDKRTVFLDKLDSPRAISLVDGGVLVAAPTNLWYYKDTNGDGVADQKTDIANNYGNLSGPEHNANGLMWGLDNWIYSANHTVRYRYEGNGKFSSSETITRGQWGITQDDVGRLYYNSNSDPLRVDLLPSAYLRRNPGFQAAGTNIAPQTSPLTIYPSRPQPGINRGYQGLNPDGTYSSVTSATGTMVYRGTQFPKEFSNDVFIGEPTANLVKRIKMEEVNGTLTARNAYPEGSEFLTSTDERFRPVTMYNGPDGALYIIDMYHGIIQHKNYVTTYLRKQIIDRKLDAPIHVGRIFRVVPDTAPARPVMADLSRSTPAQLVTFLGDANGWTRDTAQRLLVEKRDAAIAPALRNFAGTSANPLGKVHALWALDGLNSLDAPTAIKALADADPRVVVTALRVSEKLFAAAPAVTSTSNAILDRVLALANSSDPGVRLQLALTLGEAKTPAADAVLRQLVLANPTQPYLADAVISSLAGRDEKFALALIAETRNGATPPSVFVQQVSGVVLRSNDAPRIETLLENTLADSAPAWARTAVLDSLQGLTGAAAGGGRAGGVGGGGGGGRAGGGAAGGAAPAAAGAAGPGPPAAPGRGAARGAAGAVGGRGGAGGGRGGAAGGTMLPAEPKALTALAGRNSGPDSARAVTLLQSLRWTGKPGLEVAAVVPLTATEQALFDKGKVQFDTLCASCHQPNAQGLAGIAPSLVNSSLLLGDDRVLARIVLAGKSDQTTTPPIQMLTMPAMRGLLNDEAVAAALTYLRRSFGHTASPVSPATVAEARSAVADKQDNYNNASVDQLIRQLSAQPRVGGRGAP
jgi:glucose/arabinose dehydrogenase/mono/diheme cytochrome c family protein